MSKYTTQVRYLCESLSGLNINSNADNIDDVLNKSWDKIFNNFPIFNEEHRKALCIKILKHYYTREIGEESFGLWKLRINTKLEEIMPYYNELYSTIGLIDNPLVDKDITRTVSAGMNGSNNTVQNSSGKSKNKYSDTPQGGLSGIESDEYLTNVRITDDTASGSSNTQVQQSENRTENIKGIENGKSYSQLLIEYRDTFINIDMLIIKELSGCFMNVW